MSFRATPAELSAACWRKSTKSGSDDNCVELAFLPALVAVRDSKDTAGPALAFPAADWSAFVTGIRAGALA